MEMKKLLLWGLIGVLLLSSVTAWWDSDWKSRFCFNLTDPGHTLEPTRVNLSKVCAPGISCKANYDDLRVIDQADQELRYELLNNQYHNATPYHWLYFIAENTSEEFCVYYNNTAATPKSDNSFFYLVDEFDEDELGTVVGECSSGGCNWYADYSNENFLRTTSNSEVAQAADNTRCANSYWKNECSAESYYNVTLPFIAIQKVRPLSDYTNFIMFGFGFDGYNDAGSLVVHQTWCGGAPSGEGWHFRCAGCGEQNMLDYGVCTSGNPPRVLKINMTDTVPTLWVWDDNDTYVGSINAGNTTKTTAKYRISERHTGMSQKMDFIYLINTSDAFAYNSTPNEPDYPFCNATWACSDYADCNVWDIEECLNVTDIYGCGESFNGSLTPFNLLCDYCTPAWACNQYGNCSNNNKECFNVSDSNDCYAVTGNSNDLFMGIYGDYNGTCGYIPEYEVGDIAPAMVDFIGESGVQSKRHVGFLIVMFCIIIFLAILAYLASK